MEFVLSSWSGLKKRWKNIMPLPELSVVVCTRNRIASLRRCVDALFSATTTRSWELVIVDNGSTDGTNEFLKSVTATRPYRPHVITVFEQTPGLAKARNKGWRAATAEIMAFTDDDCYEAAN